MTLPFDHTRDLDLGVSRSESEIALSQEWGGWLTWNEKDLSNPFMTIILTNQSGTKPKLVSKISATNFGDFFVI